MAITNYPSQNSFEESTKSWQEYMFHCFLIGRKVPQDCIIQAWKSFEANPQSITQASSFYVASAIILSDKNTFKALNMTQESFDKIYLAAWNVGIIAKIAKDPLTPVIHCEKDLAIPYSLSAMRSEYFRNDIEMLPKTAQNEVLRIWNCFVNSNSLLRSQEGLGEALFFAYDIKCMPFIKILASQVLKETDPTRMSVRGLDRSGLRHISHRLADHLLIKFIKESNPTIPKIDIKKNQKTFCPRNLSELRSVEIRHENWDMTLLNQLEILKPKGNLISSYFQSKPVEIGPDQETTKDALGIFFAHVNPESAGFVESLNLSNGIADFLNKFTADKVQFMRKFQNLKQLNLSYSNFEFKPDVFEALISSLPNLMDLTITDSILKDEHMKSIGKSLNLQTLSLKNCHISKELLIFLDPLSQLKLLDLSNVIEKYKFIPRSLIRDNLKIKINTRYVSSIPKLDGCPFPHSILAQAIAKFDVEAVRILSKSHSEEVYKIDPDSNLRMIDYFSKEQTSKILLQFQICEILWQINPISIINENNEHLSPVHYLFRSIAQEILADKNVDELINIAKNWLSTDILQA